MGGCKELGSVYLYVTNTLTLIFGIVVLGFAVYFYSSTHQQFDGLDELSSPVIAALTLGTFLIVFSAIGLCGTCANNRCLLFIYILGVLAAAVAVVASGIVLLVFGDRFQQTGDGTVSARVDDKIIAFESAVFNNCCNTVGGFTAIQECGEISVQPEVCYDDVNAFEDFSAAIDEETCKLFEDIEFKGKPLVGDETDGGCGGGVAKFFVKNVNEYINSNFRKLGGLCIFFGSIIFLMLIAACCVICDDDARKR